MRLRHQLCVWSLGACAALWVQSAPAQEPGNSLPATNAPIILQKDGSFRVGPVEYNARAKLITIPALVNMVEGQVEYLLVHETGKAHESIFTTGVQPYQLHLAVLMIGQASTNSATTNLSFKIHAEWVADGKTNVVPVDRFIRNLQTLKNLEARPWPYVGSRVVDGVFLAQRDGSFIPIMEDGDALFANPRPERERDDIWEPDGKHLPAKGKAVTLQFKP